MPTKRQRYITTEDGGTIKSPLLEMWTKPGHGGHSAGDHAEVGRAADLAAPTTLTPGSSVMLILNGRSLRIPSVETTPLARNDSFPNRIAIFRSSKTEAQFPGHFSRVNELCDWLETKGYSTGNGLDIAFDDLTWNGQPVEIFDAGTLTNWTRDAG
jgi:hypothetical protein